MPGFTDDRHPAAVEEWVFAVWNSQGTLGVISGHRIVGRTAWYWASLARAGRPLLSVTDFDVPVRADPFIVKGEALWAEHHCDSPMEQWTIGNETYASALADADEALGRGYGDPTPIAFDLEWYATGEASTLATASASGSASGYEQPGVVHGTIDVLGEPPIDLVEQPAHRWHRWTFDPAASLGPIVLPEVTAHTGVRSPFAFPDGTVSDLVLTRAGWSTRARRVGR